MLIIALLKLSNASAGRGFSFETWLSKGRRFTTGNLLMNSLITILELGKEVDEMPSEYWVNVLAEWKAKKKRITITRSKK